MKGDNLLLTDALAHCQRFRYICDLLRIWMLALTRVCLKDNTHKHKYKGENKIQHFRDTKSSSTLLEIWKFALPRVRLKDNIRTISICLHASIRTDMEKYVVMMYFTFYKL